MSYVYIFWVNKMCELEHIGTRMCALREIGTKNNLNKRVNLWPKHKLEDSTVFHI